MEVENRLTTKTSKVKVLKLQLQFRQKVISQVYIDSSVFKFSQNGKQHSITRLKENLCKLLEPPSDTHSITCSPIETAPRCLSLEEVQSNPVRLVGHQISHRFEDASNGNQTHSIH